MKKLNELSKAVHEYAKEITKNILIVIWSVTIFPLMLIWMFITEGSINK